MNLFVHMQYRVMLRVFWADEATLERQNAYLLYGVDAQSDNQARDYLAEAAFAFAFASLVLMEGIEARFVLKQVEAFYSKTLGPQDDRGWLAWAGGGSDVWG